MPAPSVGYSFSRTPANSSRLSAVSIGPTDFVNGASLVPMTDAVAMAQATAQLTKEQMEFAKNNVVDMSALSAGITSAGESIGSGLSRMNFKTSGGTAMAATTY